MRRLFTATGAFAPRSLDIMTVSSGQVSGDVTVLSEGGYDAPMSYWVFNADDM